MAASSGTARGEPTGMLQEGAADLVSRLLPEATAQDWDEALLTAQAHLLSLGITGWQDAIIGSGFGGADPTDAYLRAAQAGHPGGQRGRRPVVGPQPGPGAAAGTAGTARPPGRPGGSGPPA